MHVGFADPGSGVQTRLNDPPVTCVGAMMRRHGLDELPRLFTVMRGDTSLIGPRPYALGMLVRGAALSDPCTDYRNRCRVSPGLTRLAQAGGLRGELDIKGKVRGRIRCHLRYLANWSLLLNPKLHSETIRSAGRKIRWHSIFAAPCFATPGSVTHSQRLVSSSEGSGKPRSGLR